MLERNINDDDLEKALTKVLSSASHAFHCLFRQLIALCIQDSEIGRISKVLNESSNLVENSEIQAAQSKAEAQHATAFSDRQHLVVHTIGGGAYFHPNIFSDADDPFHSDWPHW